MYRQFNHRSEGSDQIIEIWLSKSEHVELRFSPSSIVTRQVAGELYFLLSQAQSVSFTKEIT